MEKSCRWTLQIKLILFSFQLNWKVNCKYPNKLHKLWPDERQIPNDLIWFDCGASVHTSSLMIKLGRLPLPSSGGINEPRRLDGPEPGANEPLRSDNGLFSRITSIFGAAISTDGALISGTLTNGISCCWFWSEKKKNKLQTLTLQLGCYIHLISNWNRIKYS